MVVVLRTLLNLGNDHVLRPFDLKIVRRSRTLGDEQARGLNEKRIVFFHAPKCGGTSVHKLLATAFGGPAGLDPIAAEAAARAGYDAGTRTITDVLDAKSRVVQARARRNASGYALVIRLLTLNATAGRLNADLLISATDPLFVPRVENADLKKIP